MTQTRTARGIVVLLLSAALHTSTAHAQHLKYADRFAHGALGGINFFFGILVREDAAGEHLYVPTIERIQVYERRDSSWDLLQTFTDPVFADGDLTAFQWFDDFQLSPDGRNAYVTTEDATSSGLGETYKIGVFSVSPVDGTLSLIQVVDSAGVSPMAYLGQIAVTQDRVYTTAWTNSTLGVLLVFERLPDGTLSFIERKRPGPDWAGDAIEVVGSQIYTGGIDLSANGKIEIFDIVPGGGVEWRASRWLPTSQPNQVVDFVVSADGSRLYTSRPSCEWNPGDYCGRSTIDYFARDGYGNITHVQSLEEGIDMFDVLWPQEMALTPNENGLLVTALGSSSLTFFDIDPVTGQLTQAQQYKAETPPIGQDPSDPYSSMELGGAATLAVDASHQEVYTSGEADAYVERFVFDLNHSAGKGIVKLQEHPTKGWKKFTVALKNGEASTLSDFRDPVNATTTYEVQLTVDNSTVSTLIAEPGAYDKATRKGWKPLGSGKGYIYKAKGGANATGLTKLKLLVGDDGKAKVLAKAKDGALTWPALSATTHVDVSVSNGFLVWDAEADLGSRSGKYNPKSGLFKLSF